jgi:hypothetical protein
MAAQARRRRRAPGRPRRTGSPRLAIPSAQMGRWNLRPASPTCSVDRAAPSVECRVRPRLTIPSGYARRNLWSASPRCGSGCLADQRAPHPATTTRSADPVRQRGSWRQPGRRSFFMRILRRGIGLRMAGAHRDVAERQGLQNPPDAALVHRHEKACQYPLSQIAQPPANDTVFSNIRTLADPGRKLRLLLNSQLRRRTTAVRTAR